MRSRVSARRAAPPLAGWGLVVALLGWVAGCNQLTGVSGLKVARCAPDAGPDTAACQTERNSLSERDGGSSRRATDPELGEGSGARGGGSGDDGSEGSGSRGPDGMSPAGSAGPLSCEPGSLVQCLGPGSCSGTQTCRADGAGVSACECGPEPVVSAGSVGAACAEDEDCSSGLGCTTALATSGPFLASGVQNGFCSRPCAGDADCVGSDPGAICVSHASGPAFCFQECSPAQPSFPEQCNGRSELLCLPLSGSQRGYCAPACQTDGDCAPRACDLATGLCVDEEREGEAIGAACSSDDDCAAGLCLSSSGQPPACTGLCTLGSVAGCGFGEREPERSAACTSSAGAELGLGRGVGLCQELCDVDDDCLQADSGWACTPWPSELTASGQGFEERFGSIGFCEAQAGAGGGGEPGCNDSCLFASNGSCDDPESLLPLCDLGTDCSDCGPR